MLSENIKTIRKSKGYSQEELAVKLNVVRQTISKWEQGLSVPDSEMLISISEILEVPVSTLLGENVIEQETNDLKVISKKLEVINLQLSNQKETRRKIGHGMAITLCAILIILYFILIISDGFYLNWDYTDPETAVLGVVLHGLAWLFVRIAPLLLIGSIIIVYLTRKHA